MLKSGLIGCLFCLHQMCVFLIFLGYLCRACERFSRSDAHVHTKLKHGSLGLGRPIYSSVVVVWVRSVRPRQRDVAEGLVC